MLLRLKRGSFLGVDRSQRVWYGGVFLPQRCTRYRHLRVLNGTSYEFSVEMILNDLTTPLIWVVVLDGDHGRTFAQAKQAQADRYGSSITG